MSSTSLVVIGEGHRYLIHAEPFGCLSISRRPDDADVAFFQGDDVGAFKAQFKAGIGHADAKAIDLVCEAYDTRNGEASN
jgi:hypothetical protein